MSLAIFKTNVETPQDADYLLKELRRTVSDGVINFDLEDTNHILRIEINREISEIVCSLFVKQGFYCQKL
jgi:predicted nucleotidyltransferase